LVAERPASVVPLVLDSRLLAAPEEVLPQLTGPDQQAVLRIPLPGWVWSLQHRNQWREAVQQWSRLGNVVILVELPPATVPENLLLAESLPNVIWVSDCREANAAVTRRHVQTLRQSRCRLAGAVLSHARPSGLQERFARWLACLLLLWSWQQFPSLAAEEPSSPAAASSEQVGGSFSALASTKRAAWQEQLTLGPGDLLNFSLFGQTELSRPDVAIAPDGTVSFLEAQNVMAAGLTIDQLRSRFDEELAKYRRAPRTMITPAAFRSKKYFMLGRVAQRGVFVLDRPMTIIEAVANAQGLETALVENHTMELADYSRSFLMRRGQRLAVNFEKLFQQGDLSQNVALEPNDYLYFPAATVREVYVLGEVLRPGPVAFRTGLGAVGAVAARGGFSEKAWRHKVLVVRGSLNKPEAFPLNTADVVKARTADFKLEPRDIVYVSARPWIKVEEVLDAAATAFIEAVVITWGGKALF
jgi:protein involved in polysaccharide export with SLBB domain